MEKEKVIDTLSQMQSTYVFSAEEKAALTYAIVNLNKLKDCDKCTKLGYNQALSDMKSHMEKLWNQYESDKENVPKPDFISCIALISVLENK